MPPSNTPVASARPRTGTAPAAARRRPRLPALAVLAVLVALLCAAGDALAVAPPGGAGGGDRDKPDPYAVRQLRHGIMPGVSVAGASRAGRAAGLRLDKVLTILVEFAGTDSVGGASYTGPLHNRIPAPSPGDNTTYWVADFSPQHYRDMLFGTSQGSRSMSAYFRDQSGGAYSVSGEVYGWVEVSHAEAYYGAAQGARVPELVAEAVKALGDEVPWSDYDQDHDGVVDHVQVVHAGAEVAGSWTIWAHSATLSKGVPTSDPGVVVRSYTIQPENGTIGVFCHEFGHSLGLPDLYDIAYTGEASTSYWTLMSTGSWVGAPGEAVGTAPASLGPWERAQLGWVKPVVVTPGQRKKSVKLSPAGTTGGTRAIRIDLPDYEWTLSVPVPHGGAQAWWSGRGDLMTTTLTRDVMLPAGSVLAFWTWYDIEPGYDYGYVEVRPTDSDEWKRVKGSITTDDDPYLANEGSGITGPSVWAPGNVDGSVLATFDLSAFTGPCTLRFRYVTDTAMTGDGWTWSDLAIRAGGETVFSDSGASLQGGWQSQGWRQTAGEIRQTADNYYMLEWRAPVGSDVGMTCWPNWVSDTTSEPYRALPGMLVWYYTDQFSDELVGKHPWQGMLQVVDARPGRLSAAGTQTWAQQDFGVDEGLPAPVWVNLADATFNTGLQPGQRVSVGYDQGTAQVTIPAGPREARFDDAKPWTDQFWRPSLRWDSGVWPACFTPRVLTESLNSTVVPLRGVKISVKPGAGTFSGGLVTVDYRKPVKP